VRCGEPGLGWSRGSRASGGDGEDVATEGEPGTALRAAGSCVIPAGLSVPGGAPGHKILSGWPWRRLSLTLPGRGLWPSGLGVLPQLPLPS
jgi:hypothetical protein